MDDLKQSLEEQAKALKESKYRSDQSSRSPAVGTATSVDSRDPQLPNRPVGVTILSVVIGLFILGFFSKLMLLPILFSPTDRTEVEGIGPPILVGVGVGVGVGLAFGALYIAVALGLWRLRKWARWGANVILALTLLGVPLSGAADPLVFLTVLAACIGGLWYLNRRKVRDLFS